MRCFFGIHKWRQSLVYTPRGDRHVCRTCERCGKKQKKVTVRRYCTRLAHIAPPHGYDAEVWRDEE